MDTEPSPLLDYEILEVCKWNRMIIRMITDSLVFAR